MSLEVELGSCNESSVTPPYSAPEVIGMNVEEDIDVHIKVEEIPEAITYPSPKAEQDEVSYLSLCVLLGTFHQYPEKPAVLHCLHLFVCPTTPLCCMKISFSFGFCVSPVRKFASKYMLISAHHPHMVLDILFIII